MDFKITKVFRDEFPDQLLEIPDVPEALYYVGKPLPKDGLYLSVVGSRTHTTYGADACAKLIEGLRGSPILIVSGLALGIDSIAHRSALKAGLATIAFPGSGLSEGALYPASNLSLAKEILANGGTLVSEFEPSFKATQWSFPRRNRLMAGISHAVLVIEASDKSGTLITARLAIDYNCDLLVVPGPITSPTSIGANLLLKQGATPITRSEDILEAFGLQSIEKQETKQSELALLSEAEQEIIALLTEPRAREDIFAILGKPAHEINITLSSLEIKGLIKEEYGEVRRI